MVLFRFLNYLLVLLIPEAIAHIFNAMAELVIPRNTNQRGKSRN